MEPAGNDLTPEEVEAQEIRQQLRRARRRFERNLGGLKEQAQRIFDWREYARRHPLAVIGSGFAVGYFLVPRRSANIHRLIEANREIANETVSKLAGTPPAQPKSVLERAGESLLQTALTYSAQWLLQNFYPRVAQPEREEPHGNESE